jgi:hypothetical protein
MAILVVSLENGWVDPFGGTEVESGKKEMTL